MDVLTLPASPPTGQVATASSLAPEPAVLVLRVRRVFPPHAGCSGEGIVTVEARDANGWVVTAYLHVPAELLCDFGRCASSWATRTR